MKTRIIIILLLSCIICALCQWGTAQEKKRRPRIGLVLSGGGAKGIAHIGVLKVLEEAGLKIDYITGTSMGSIVGGLYASGYNANMLEKLVNSIDWDDLLADAVYRRSISIEEKNSHDKYIGSFQLRKWGIDLPKGIKRGQKLTSLMSSLTLHVQHITDFNNLYIPFRCIGTDIVTGEAVVLDSGYLPDAMRASMSIPTIFTPIEIDGRLLVDGGVVRNLPVSDAREMGADIIIAVDVGAPLYKKEELVSVAEIMDQSVSFLGAASTQQQRLMSDILVIPDITGFSGSDFKRGKELIKIGEDAARLALPEIKKLVDQQKSAEDREAPKPIKALDMMHITEIQVEGLKKVSRNLVMGKLLIKAPARVTPKDLMAAIARVYASNFFERVTYQIEPINEKEYRLIIRVIETTGTYLKLGLSYDNDRQAAILINTTFRNLAGQGSKISLDARLSENPGIYASYFIHTGARKPGIGFGAAIRYDKLKFYTYKQKQIKTYYDYQNVGADILMQATLLNSFAIGAGVQKDFTPIDNQTAIDDPKKKDVEALNYFGYIMFDNLDRTFYPRSGFQLYGEAKYVSDDLAIKKKTEKFSPFMKFKFSMTGYIPFHRRFVIFLGLTGGSILAKEPYYMFYDLKIYRREVPFVYKNYLGGLHTYMPNCFPFTGLNFMQISGNNAMIVSGGFQIEFFKDLYLILRGNAGRVKDRFLDLFKQKNRKRDYFQILYNNDGDFNPYERLKNDIIYGYGLTVGYDSIIGPVELTVMHGSEGNKVFVHVNIGYRM